MPLVAVAGSGVSDSPLLINHLSRLPCTPIPSNLPAGGAPAAAVRQTGAGVIGLIRLIGSLGGNAIMMTAFALDAGGRAPRGAVFRG